MIIIDLQIFRYLDIGFVEFLNQPYVDATYLPEAY